MLRKAEGISIRLNNCFCFLYLAFNSYNWVAAFLFHMNVLEALFSKDEGGSATKDICSRISGLLHDPTRWSYETIKDLYVIRSQMTHGRFEANYESNDNLRLLEKMECLTKLCLRKLIELDAFPVFATPSTRNQFMEQLEKSSSQPCVS
jgi:hypothetical protein